MTSDLDAQNESGTLSPLTAIEVKLFQNSDWEKDCPFKILVFFSEALPTPVLFIYDQRKNFLRNSFPETYIINLITALYLRTTDLKNVVVCTVISTSHFNPIEGQLLSSSCNACLQAMILKYRLINYHLETLYDTSFPETEID